MPGFYQTLFAVSLTGLSWYGMMAVHETGHVLAAVLTGAVVEAVVLPPFAISHTAVSENSCPAVVVWTGPLAGCLLPVAAWLAVPRRWDGLRNAGCFFAGFCLISNGLYIAAGAVPGIGDCREMLRTGTPVWLMVAFGMLCAPVGLGLWHRLGSVSDFLRTPGTVTPQIALYTLLALLLVVVAAAAAGGPGTMAAGESGRQTSAVSDRGSRDRPGSVTCPAACARSVTAVACRGPAPSAAGQATADAFAVRRVAWIAGKPADSSADIPGSLPLSYFNYPI